MDLLWKRFQRKKLDLERSVCGQSMLSLKNMSRRKSNTKRVPASRISVKFEEGQCPPRNAVHMDKGTTDTLFYSTTDTTETLTWVVKAGMSFGKPLEDILMLAVVLTCLFQEGKRGHFENYRSGEDLIYPSCSFQVPCRRNNNVVQLQPRKFEVRA